VLANFSDFESAPGTDYVVSTWPQQEALLRAADAAIGMPAIGDAERRADHAPQGRFGPPADDRRKAARDLIERAAVTVSRSNYETRFLPCGRVGDSGIDCEMDLDSATNLIIERTAVDPVDLRLRVRYARADGLLPRKPRGGPQGRIAPPQIESLQATILLLTCLSGGPQIQTPKAVRSLWALPRYGDGPTFGQQLFYLTEIASSATGRKNFQEKIMALNVAHNQKVAVIKHSDSQMDEYFVDPAATVEEDRQAVINSLFVVSPQLFLILGEVVMRNREAARQLRTSISWRETWLALGFEPPTQPFPLTPLLPLSSPSSASITAEDGTKNAGPLSQGPAPSLDQDHNLIRDPDSPKTRRERDEAQAACDPGHSLSTSSQELQRWRNPRFA
jgi:hypothetical protein